MPARERALGQPVVHETVNVQSKNEGPSGNYFFELKAQPGGPEGRSFTTAGSK